MKPNTRSWIMLIIGIIATLALIIADYCESGLSLKLFAWPCLTVGCIIIPSIIDILKNKSK